MTQRLLLCAVLALTPIVSFAKPLASESGTPGSPGGANWWKPRHEAAKKAIAEKKPDLLFIGDSITHWWGGIPNEASKNTASSLYDHYYGHRNAVNLGYASDRTYNTIWRLRNGELEGVKPKVAVVMIGTNNHPIPGHSGVETAKGVAEICKLVHKASPSTKILLLSVFPRTRAGAAGYSEFIPAVNKELAKLDGKNGITFLDLTEKLGKADGTCNPAYFYDGLHPNAAGYKAWAEAMEPTLANLLGDKPVEPMK